ncbi:MAG: acyl-CoA dehydrogenase family protein [Thermoanaerobaculia bacterium]|nr:acyl-CoA dehydrogenase family protein [Thermoanaerobaculia bacterium]
MTQQVHVTEQEAMKVAEESRQKEWNQPSFMRELFLGNFRLDLIHPYPLAGDERPELTAFYNAMKEFVTEHVDSDHIDTTGEYPASVIDGLKKLGAFGMKIPKEYGGLGFDQVEYAKIMELLGGVDGNLSALLSAHQSIGVPQPLKLFGSAELKKEYLPRCAQGAISAFALTEHDVGSDPARMTTSYTLSDDGEHYILNGTKLWCTNGTIAELLVVMATDAKTRKISAFVVETGWKGVKVEHRCHFMGLRALANAVISFTDVQIPVGNLIGEEGRGLKIALTTLNDGRLSIPNGSVGTAKTCLKICREWSSERVQWGKPIGKHEAISHKIADMAATTFAMESVAKLATEMSNQGNRDIRLEAAAAKEWNTCRTWEMVDDTMQIRGGRGYETSRSLKARGDKPIAVERMMRDYRINKIFEGSSEIMHLLMAREAVDKHLTVAGAMIDPEKSVQEKLQELPAIAAFYASWYPTRWLNPGKTFAEFGNLAGHVRFAERATRRLSRQVFHGMMVHQAAMQNKQVFLFRLVDIGNELFAMAAAVSRAHALRQAGKPEAEQAVELADLFCRGSRRKIKQLFRDLWSNDDNRKYRTAMNVLKGRHRWLEKAIEGLEQNVAVAEEAEKQSTVAA